MDCDLRAPSHYVNQCWLITVKSSDDHLRAIWQEITQSSITKISLKITYTNFNSNLPGVNELIWNESHPPRRPDRTFMKYKFSLLKELLKLLYVFGNFCDIIVHNDKLCQFYSRFYLVIIQYTTYTRVLFYKESCNDVYISESLLQFEWFTLMATSSSNR